MDVRGPKIIAGDFEPGGRVTVQYKDLGIALDAADELKVPLPGTALARQLYSALLAAGRAGWDHSAVITVLEDLAGVKARTAAASHPRRPSRSRNRRLFEEPSRGQAARRRTHPSEH